MATFMAATSTINCSFQNDVSYALAATNSHSSDHCHTSNFLHRQSPVFIYSQFLKYQRDGFK